jgi:hypothetical protein
VLSYPNYCLLVFLGLATSADCNNDYTKNGLKWSCDLRMNQIQVIGTHNSYHLETPLAEKQHQLLIYKNPQKLLYSHPTLDIQAKYQSVRSFELDLFADPRGGHYANPLVKQWANTSFDTKEMMPPGTKILHVSDADVESNCKTLVSCLQVLKRWSRDHPFHVPIPFMIEFKAAGATETAIGGATAIYWNNNTLLEGVDNEIRSVFNATELITPDDIRRSNTTLEESVLRYGWPDLDSARGRVLFLIDNGPNDTIRTSYIENRPNLEGRAMFTNSAPGNSDCAFQKVFFRVYCYDQCRPPPLGTSRVK